MRKHNFNAGPSVLPEIALENTAKAVLDLNGIGMSVMEISHRSKEFEAILNETIALFKELLNIPEGYSVLFLGGGASLQFCMIPFNLLNKKAAYLNSGVWASKAMKEAKFFGETVEVASSKADNYTYIPKNFSVPADADYFHITTNNTIYGTELKEDLSVNVPLIADMSSDIMSRPIDVSKYAMIYGGAQKNIGPAGMAFVIIKNDILGKVQRPIPSMLNYQTHIENNSLYNTPPVITIFGCYETLKWIKSIGGVEKMQKMNIEKAQLLYDEIDRNKLFKGTVTDVKDRSLMNVCFVMSDEYKDLENEFLEFTKPKGFIGLKGHRSVGGFRASLYNALPKASVVALVDAMKEFEKLKLK
jgi:phosphoserine aminotransferase